MSKHTPGPWIKTRGDGASIYIYPEKAHGMLGTCHNNQHMPLAKVTLENDDFTSDNADLIVAAPDLLEALKNLVHFAGDKLNEFGAGQALLKARTAIEKAEGRAEPSSPPFNSFGSIV